MQYEKKKNQKEKFGRKKSKTKNGFLGKNYPAPKPDGG